MSVQFSKGKIGSKIGKLRSKVKYKIHLYLIPRAKVNIYNGIEHEDQKLI